MAESIARYHGHEAYSGGTEPGNSVSGNAIKALLEGDTPRKALSQNQLISFTQVITI